MSAYVGGVRDRLIFDSVYAEIRDALDGLGWFDDPVDSQGDPLRRPFRLQPEGFGDDGPVTPNVAGVTFSTYDGDDEMEMGSMLTENRLVFYVDVYAENDDVGRHLAGDLRDLLRGRMPSIGRGRPYVDVLDYNQATPTTVFTVEIANVSSDHPVGAGVEHRKHWWVLRFEIVDTYTDEDDE